MTATDATVFHDEPVDPPLAMPAAPVDAVPIEVVTTAEVREDPLYSPPMRLLRLPAIREGRVDAWLWSMLAISVAALYLYALLGFWAPANPGTDQNGYFVGGRQFAHTLSSGLSPESPFNFVGRMWVMAPSGVNYPKYPLGLPILFSLFIWTFGERGYEYAHLISPVASALATLGVFAITRRIAGGFLGIMAMLLLGCGQIMLTLSVNPNSHAAGVCAVVWGMFFLIRWLQTGSIWRGIAAGALFGFAYTIRYTEGLLLLPIAAALVYAARWAWPTMKRLVITFGATILLAAIVLLIAHVWGARLVVWRPFLTPLGGEEGNGKPLVILVALASFAAIVSTFVERRALMRLLSLSVAWLVPVAYLTLFNMVAMQSLTSYAGTNESTGFSLDYFQANWEKMVRVIHDQGLFFIAPIGVMGLVLMYRRLPMVATILTLWFVPSVLLYTAYYWAPDNQGVSYSRFVLTQVPALIVAAAWLMGDLTRRPLRNATGRIAVGLVVFVSCALGIYRTVLGSEWGQRLNMRANLEIQSRQNANLAGFGREVRRAIDGPAKENEARKVHDDSDVLLFADGDRLNHLQWIGGWQLFSTDAFSYERSARQLNRVIDENDPDPIDPSRIKFLQGVYKGKDQRALQSDQNNLIANALKAGKRVYFAMSDNQSKVFGRQIDRKQFDVKEVGSFNDVPAPRLAEDFLLPGEKPKQPVNRFGRGNAFAGPNFLGNEKMSFKIGRVMSKTTATTQP